MKKIAVMILTVVALFSAGCSSKKEGSASKATEVTTTTVPVTTAPVPETTTTTVAAPVTTTTAPKPVVTCGAGTKLVGNTCAVVTTTAPKPKPVTTTTTKPVVLVPAANPTTTTTTPAPVKTWKTVATFNGVGEQNTAEFVINSDHQRITWNCSSSPSIYINMMGNDGSGTDIDCAAPSSSGSQMPSYSSPGTYYLHVINSFHTTWSWKIEELS